MNDKIKAWEFPFVEDEQQIAADRDKTNAINKKPQWQYEPPEADNEQQTEELSLPTADEIEEIRQAAHNEGFEQGKQQGLEQGLAEGKEQGYQQGYDEGFDKGNEEGLTSGAEQIQQQLQVLESMLSHITQPMQQVDKQLENELVVLATELAKAVIRTEVETNKNIIFQAITEGLNVLPIAEKMYQIRLHPDDVALIKEHFSDEDIERHHWRLVETPDMTRGGCDIVTDSNAVDLSIERRTRDILDKFLLQQGLDYQ
ncbi:flagellar assembly protein FliH [Neptunicella marina]|uniref:Flagellar assembly protein FliH n=1 Tax=Neptunicella marina TaxID=2125989 RepID=A0A8J6IT80_9ALTE|nr:flagellar assembly protein FliH [Neptunicella marina]MBC3764998.1 flagellar assembly protein FliH [Neptunicella marina]